jgi:hypothetical protein
VFKKKESTLPKVKLEPGMSKGEWMQKYWRPCAAFMYMICCLADFAIFPIMFTVVQFWETQAANDAFRQWVPITLQGGGLFHVSMCAVLGVSAYGRTQEKLAGQSATPAGLPSPTLSSTPPAGGLSNGFATTTTAPSVPTPTNNFGTGSSFATPNPAPGGFGGGSAFGTTASAEVATGFGGKPAPVMPPFPER